MSAKRLDDEASGIFREVFQNADAVPALRAAISPMVEAYRLWTVGKMSASEFGAIADPCIVAYDKLRRSA